MEKYTRIIGRFEKAFEKFREIIENPAILEFFKEEFIVEIATKRFEYTFESMWKATKEFLRLMGIECNSPRSCFEELIKEGAVEENFEKILAKMIILRNELVHTYDEMKAKNIYEQIRNKEITETFKQVLKALSEHNR